MQIHHHQTKALVWLFTLRSCFECWCLTCLAFCPKGPEVAGTCSTQSVSDCVPLWLAPLQTPDDLAEICRNDMDSAWFRKWKKFLKQQSTLQWSSQQRRHRWLSLAFFSIMPCAKLHPQHPFALLHLSSPARIDSVAPGCDSWDQLGQPTKCITKIPRLAWENPEIAHITCKDWINLCWLLNNDF